MTIKNIIIRLVLGLLILLAILLIRTLSFSPQSVDSEQYEPVSLNASQISAHLSQAVQFQTVSKQNPAHMDYAAFTAFIDWVAVTYPEVHAELELVRINDLTLLYKWKGQNESLPPVLLSGHYDVVPVIPGTESDWAHAPYAGVVDETYIWGRGTLDDKSAVIGMLEALTVLVKQEFKPRRTIYVAATHDEEIGSVKGAGGIVDWMKANDVTPMWSLDEVRVKSRIGRWT